jgi:hypothetical protein
VRQVVSNENKPANQRDAQQELIDKRSSSYWQMHEIFNRLDEEVWISIESFCVPLEQLRAPEPLKPATHPQKKEK